MGNLGDDAVADLSNWCQDLRALPRSCWPCTSCCLHVRTLSKPFLSVLATILAIHIHITPCLEVGLLAAVLAVLVCLVAHFPVVRSTTAATSAATAIVSLFSIFRPPTKLVS